MVIDPFTVAIATAKSLALALTTEVADMVVGEVVNLAEEEREDIKVPSSSSLTFHLLVESIPIVKMHIRRRD